VLATDISADGSVVVGNTVGAYETFRWTQSTGIVPLGRATAPVLGVGAGTPDVSWDGNHISATILDDTGTLATQGRWTNGAGWQELMPPVPPGGGVLDQSLGSAWGLSGDGSTVTGFFWRPGQPGGSAHASSWTQATGVVDLGSDGNSSSGRGANYDGSVIVGWDEHPSFGNRRPAVWVNGVKTVFTPDNDGPSELTAANADGTIVVGSDFNFPANHEDAAIWRYVGGSWVVQNLGSLPGTVVNGLGISSDVTADGSMVVGYNRLNFNFLTSTGTVWTAQTGLISATQFLTDNGVTLPAGFLITDFAAISADGSTIVGNGLDANFNSQAFLIHIPEPSGLGLLGLALPLLVRCRKTLTSARAAE
jgi:uncharacterized membrane protein